MDWSRVSRLVLDNVHRLPESVGRMLASINRNPDLVYGRAYRRYRELHLAREKSSDHAHRLFESVNAAIRDVPFYRMRHGATQITSLAQFESQISFVDKEMIVASPEDFVSATIDRGAYDRCSTGGTTGRPLSFLAPKSRYAVELATMHSLWAQAGYRHHLRAVIRNHRVPADQPYLVNPITREIIFDGFHLTDDYFEHVCRVLDRLGIEFVHCYPSTAFELARFIQRRGAAPRRLRVFLSGSENVSSAQRDLIEGEMGLRFYNWYGHSEKLVLAGYCANSNDYHVEPAYGYFELVDEEGRVLRTPGAVGEIVGTSLHNPGMPFIRYRTGDRAEYVSDQCGSCGRRVPIIRNIQGRWSGERIYKADGTFVTTTALNLHGAESQVLNGLQYVQDRPGELTVLIVKSSRFRPEHEAALRVHFGSAFPRDFVLHFAFVERLRRHANGKVPTLVSTLVAAR